VGSGFEGILGQDVALATLERALRSRKVHHAYRFEGPDGVGKERAALAVARALVCSAGEPLGCGRCSACDRAARLSAGPPSVPLHPDVVLLGRGLYPPETIGLKSPEKTGISVAQVRAVVLARAALPPHEGRARVFVVRAAHELGVEAANALLKTLEEPVPGTCFILLTSRPDQLLSTIRSRTMPVRFAPLGDALLDGILEREGVLSAETRAAAIELAGGSASLALSLADPEASGARDAFVAAMLAAIEAPGLGAAAETGERAGEDRDVLRERLRALAARLARDARAHAADSPGRALVAARRHALVGEAIARLERNASSNLTVIDLVRRMKLVVAA
jgi:DNA polymerase-3 subunit delta'